MTSNTLAITEAYCVYNLMDSDCRKKIPLYIKEYLEENKDLSLGVHISGKFPLYLQEISDDGLKLIAYLTTFLV